MDACKKIYKNMENSGQRKVICSVVRNKKRDSAYNSGLYLKKPICNEFVRLQMLELWFE